MNSNNEFITNNGRSNEDEDSSFDIRVLWEIAQRYKWYIVTSVVVCLSIAVLYLKFATPIYSVATKILIKDEDHGYYSSSLHNTFNDMGLTNSSNGFDNELEIISTKTLNKRVVRKLKLYTTYYIDGRFKDIEIYGKYSPYVVDMLDSKLDSLEYVVKVELVKNDNLVEASLKVGDFETNTVIKGFPANIQTPYGSVSVEKNVYGIDSLMNNSSLRASIYPIETAAVAYTGGLSVEPTSKTTTVAELSMSDNIPERGVDYLNKLVEMYNEDANFDNNAEAIRTRDFIDERLGFISRDLNDTESQLQQYKTNSGIVDYKSDATLNATQNVQYEAKLIDVGTQLSLVQDLIEIVNDTKNYMEVVPADIGLSDVSLNSVISKYNEAALTRKRLLRSVSENSPQLAIATNEADGYFMTLKTSLENAKRELVIKRNQLQSQQNKYASRITSSPEKERMLGDITRQQEVKAGLYLMLLQKREENLINLESAAYKAKQIEEPIVFGPVSPKRKIILLAALAIGLALPFLYDYLRNLLRYRVEGIFDISKMTDVPLFGTVPFIKALSKGHRNIVLRENHNSLLMEVYRSLRSSLPFVLSEDQKVILFTSSTSGEGKTCIASNLGTSIAFAGKKVLIVGLDIRKPRLASLFNLSDTDKGISNYLTHNPNDTDYLESLIQKTDVSDNLDVLPAGTIPPNPAELLEKENLGCAIAYLRTKYDFVLLDTAPVGLVSDTISIAKHADLSFYVVRANYTLKADLAFLNSLYEDKRLPNLNIIFNGLKQEKQGYNYRNYRSYNKGYGKGYGYTYASSPGYGYGYGYGSIDGKLDEI